MSKFFDQEVFPVRCLFTHFIFTCAMQYFIGKSLIEEKKRICFETGWFVFSVSIEFNMILSEIRKLTNKKNNQKGEKKKIITIKTKRFLAPQFISLHILTHLPISSLKWEFVQANSYGSSKLGNGKPTSPIISYLELVCPCLCACIGRHWFVN